MADTLDKKKIHHVFRDVHRHKRIGQMIRYYSANKNDIRHTALNRIDISGCRNVLELGCAFGAFTDALKNRLHPQAHITGLDIVPEYKPFFLQSCRNAGYPGVFSAGGVHQISGYTRESFDLVICSFALYFFVEIIPDIARILKKNGFLVAITHSECNMQELIAVIKTIMQKRDLLVRNQLLPIEIIMHQFSAENGESQLAPYFQKIEKIDFKNNLIFEPSEIAFMTEYYYFKKPFFSTGTNASKNDFADELMLELKKMTAGNKSVTVCKDDRIFICSKPAPAEESNEKAT